MNVEKYLQWDRHTIKAALCRKYGSLQSFADDQDLGYSAVRNALRRPSMPIDSVISLVLDVPLHELWPERYDEHGKRREAKHKSVLDTHPIAKSRQARTKVAGAAS